MGRCGVLGEPLVLSALGNGAGMLGRAWEQLDIGVYGAHGAGGTWPRCGQSSSQDAGPQATTAHRMADPVRDAEELPKENGGNGEDSQLITEQCIKRTNKYRATLLQGWPTLVAD